MYSEELEELIDLVLDDNQITEKERAVLYRRAKAEGIDPDEIDIVIEARLAKKIRENHQTGGQTTPPPRHGTQATPPNNVKYGEIRKCPNCGATVEAASVKCEDCGYNFVGIKASTSRERLHEMINEIKRRHANKPKTKPSFIDLFTLDSEKSENEEIKEAIQLFPIPNSREDLLDFLMFLEPLAKVSFFSNSYDPSLTGVYKSKYKECCNKAEVFFADDPLFVKFFKNKK